MVGTLKNFVLNVVLKRLAKISKYSSNKGFKKICNGVYDLGAGFGLTSKCYLVNVDEQILIDLGSQSSIKYLLKQLKKLNLQPKDIKHVIFTHLHFDHIGVPMVFANAKFYASKEEIEDIEIYKRFSRFVKPPEEIYDFLRKKLVPIQELKKPYLKVIRTPGHTRGSICLFMLMEKILFSGDTLFFNGYVGRTDLPTSVPEKMENSLKKLERIRYRILCAGH